MKHLQGKQLSKMCLPLLPNEVYYLRKEFLPSAVDSLFKGAWLIVKQQQFTNVSSLWKMAEYVQRPSVTDIKFHMSVGPIFFATNTHITKLCLSLRCNHKVVELPWSYLHLNPKSCMMGCQLHADNNDLSISTKHVGHLLSDTLFPFWH